MIIRRRLGSWESGRPCSASRHTRVARDLHTRRVYLTNLLPICHGATSPTTTTRFHNVQQGHPRASPYGHQGHHLTLNISQKGERSRHPASHGGGSFGKLADRAESNRCGLRAVAWTFGRCCYCCCHSQLSMLHTASDKHQASWCCSASRMSLRSPPGAREHRRCCTNCLAVLFSSILRES